VCVPSGDKQGVLVGVDEPCPAGYTADSQTLYQGLVGEDCTGCQCDSTATKCTAELFFYEDGMACAADTAPYIGGTYAGDVTTTCPTSPLHDGLTSVFRVGAMNVVPSTGTCTPSGSPRRGNATWTQSAKFCTAVGEGVGCQFGYACVPAPATGVSCQETTSGSCARSSDDQTWYEGYVDTRSCDACTCTGAGDCGTSQVELGSDWTCGTGNPARGQLEKDCDTKPYSPPARLVGAPNDPVCKPSAGVLGELTALEAHTLCCEQ
jgi:hypothetical protein